MQDAKDNIKNTWQYEEEKVIADELQKLGIDISTEEGRSDFRNTIAWAKKSKDRCEKVTGYVVLVIIGGVLTTLGTLTVDVLKDWLKIGGH